MEQPPFARVIAGLPSGVPFVGPETLERQTGVGFVARLGANESVFGPSPRAVEAIAAAGADGWMYGDPEAFELRTALAAHHGVERANVVCGVGIDGVLGTTVRLFVEPGTPVVTSRGGYPTFAFHVRAAGGVLHEVPYRDDREDLAALAERAHAEGARIVYVANPDNPMGTWWAGTEIERLRASLPADTLLCLDEAYADTAPLHAIPTFDAGDPGVLRFRTFSKAYGLAGLRVGYALGEPQLIAAFDRVRDHFGLGRVAQAAALAALDDQEYLAAVVAQIAAGRGRIARIALANGLVPITGAANFVTVDLGRDGEYARGVLHELGRRGLFLRMPGVAPLDRCVRIGVGLPAALDALERELPAALAAV
jgi:histidinol-phosphate aminotransferase